MSNVLLSLSDLKIASSYSLNGETFLILDPMNSTGIIILETLPKVFLIEGKLFDQCNLLLKQYAYSRFPESYSVPITDLFKMELIQQIRKSSMLSLKYAKTLADAVWACYTGKPVPTISGQATCWTNPRELSQNGIQITLMIGAQYGTPTTVTLNINEEFDTPEVLFAALFKFCQNETCSWIQRQGMWFDVRTSSAPSCPSMSAGDIITMTSHFPYSQGSIWESSIWKVTGGSFEKLTSLRAF